LSINYFICLTYKTKSKGEPLLTENSLQNNENNVKHESSSPSESQLDTKPAENNSSAPQKKSSESPTEKDSENKFYDCDKQFSGIVFHNRYRLFILFVPWEQ